MLLDRYISAAQKVSRLAIGSTQTSLQADTFRLPADRTQETHVSGLPLGTRGGVSIPYTFVQDGEYEIQMWLARDLNGNVGGLRDARPQELVLLIDREPVKTFTIREARRRRHDARQGSESARARSRGPARDWRHVHQGRLVPTGNAHGSLSWRVSTSAVIRAPVLPSTRFP